jgi:hypothetical protein
MPNLPLALHRGIMYAAPSNNMVLPEKRKKNRGPGALNGETDESACWCLPQEVIAVSICSPPMRTPGCPTLDASTDGANSLSDLS